MRRLARAALLVGVMAFGACGGAKSGGPGTGGAGTGGSATGGATGGVSTGGVHGSGGQPATGGAGPATGGAGPATGGSGGATATGGHDAAGGAASGGAAGQSATGGRAGGGGHSGPGGGGGGGPRDAGADVGSAPFACTLLLGNTTTQQWFDGGFLTYPGIDPTRWELIAVGHHYVGAWADPNDVAWTSPLDGGHACAQGSQSPDRVIFIVTQSPPFPPESTYQTQTTSVVQNIRAKYPHVRQIALATLVRSPGNVPTACSTVTDAEQSIPAAEDQANAAVAAAPGFAGLVVVLPPFYVASCADFVADHPQYTAAGATDIAKLYGAYFAAHP